jgi:thiamine kinase-like enzyme
VDWEYAGFNNPLFDLGGLASNNDFSSEQEISLLEEYFEKKITDKLLEQYHAMKCSSLLRETMWSMVSEISSSLDFDYQQYTEDYYLKYKESYENLTK